MNSLFGASFFGERNFGAQPILLSGLGQDSTSPSPGPVAPTDQSDIAGLNAAIKSLLEQVPPEALGTYNAKYQKCQNDLNAGLVGDVMAGKCLYDLYNEIEAFLKNGPPKKPAVAPASEFPVLPVLVGVLGLGVLAWGLSKL